MKYFDPVVTDRYARALFHVAKRQDKTQKLLEQVQQLAHLNALGGKLAVFLESPQISTEAKLALFEKSMRGRLDDLLRGLF